MYRQDIDPLADTIPPRHAYESDEEDEFNDFTERAKGKTNVLQDVEVIFKSQGDRQGLPMIFASGTAARIWAAGAELRTEVGSVSVGGTQIAILYRPSWCDANILISEVTARLPVWAMYPFAEAILNRWKPSKVSFLDVYATSSYITSRPISHHDAPIRILRTRSGFIAPNTSFATFDPPNLLQTTIASLLSILALPSWQSVPCILFLLPSLHVSPPPPLSISSLGTVSEDNVEGWDTKTLATVHQALLGSAGIDSKHSWEDLTGALKKTRNRLVKRTGDIGEGSMYI